MYIKTINAFSWNISMYMEKYTQTSGHIMEYLRWIDMFIVFQWSFTWTTCDLYNWILWKYHWFMKVSSKGGIGSFQYWKSSPGDPQCWEISIYSNTQEKYRKVGTRETYAKYTYIHIYICIYTLLIPDSV